MKNYEIFHRSTFNKPNVSKQPGEQVIQNSLFKIRIERDYIASIIYIC